MRRGCDASDDIDTETQVLEHSPTTFVFLGSRNAARGEAAKASLLQVNSGWESRVEVLELDVGSDSSVAGAVEKLKRSYVTPQCATPLSAIVHNAGETVAPLLVFKATTADG